MASPTAVEVPTGTWSVDPVHSGVEFQIKHLGIATVKGHFHEFSGVFETGASPSDYKAYGSVSVASIDTRQGQRDEHLKAADFFDAGTYPEMTFTSKVIEPQANNTFSITGDLTIRGVTREVTFQASYEGSEQDPWGNDRVGLEVWGEVSRSDFDMNFNQALGSGNLVLGDKVKIILNLSAVKQ
jgi:polyisoprenoid-binding protein YceI